jgi:hypothetical protein
VQSYQFQPPPVTIAASGIAWQTSFDYPEWIATSGITDAICTGAVDGITGTNTATVDGSYSQITTAANNPLGTGRGFRGWKGDSTSGSGHLAINFAHPSINLPNLTEMWVRFYMRHQLGSTWQFGHPSFTKHMDWNVGLPNRLVFGRQGPGWGIFAGIPGTAYAGNVDYEDTMGGPAGDGLWHCYEFHAKQNGVNGKSSIWIDNVLTMDNVTINHGTNPWQVCQLFANMSTSTSPNDFYIDFDDIAVSNTGRIGPL